MCVCVKSLSSVQLFVTPWTVANQAPLSMGFSRQESWSVLPFPSTHKYIYKYIYTHIFTSKLCRLKFREFQF